MSEHPAPPTPATEGEAVTDETSSAPHPWADLPAEQFSLLRYLPLLLVPPATAVMLHARLIAGEFWSLAAVLCLSLLLSLLFTGWLMQQMIRRQARRREDA